MPFTISTERRALIVALIVSGALFMELLDGTVISTALPQIAHSFGEHPVDVNVGMTAYLLTLAVFIPVSGWVADRYGSRTVFACAIVLFTISSVLCGLAQNLPEFTLARILQGIGGAMMVPVGRLVVLRNTVKADLLRAMAFITTPGLIAPVLGPPVGGFITTYASWRWIFFLNVPIGALGLFAVFLFMVEQREERTRPFDALGFVLSGTGLAVLMFGFELLGRGDAAWTTVVAVLLVGGVIAAFAWRHANRHPTPMLDLSALRLPTFASALIWGGMPFRLVIGSQPLLWPLLFQVGMGMSPFVSGMLILTCAAGDVSAKSFVNPVVRRFGFRKILTANAALIAVCVAFFAVIGPGTPVFPLVLLLIVMGVFRSLTFTSVNALGYSDVAPEMMSTASTLVSTIQQLSFGIAIAFGALLLRGATFVRGHALAAVTIDDLHLAFAAMVLISLVSAFNFWRLRPEAGVAVSGHGIAQRQRAS
jgi:EmrB/QacA subfamily drug resistance transporter